MKRTFITVTLLAIPVIVSATYNPIKLSEETVSSTDPKKPSPIYVQIITSKEYEEELRKKKEEKKVASTQTNDDNTTRSLTPPLSQKTESVSIRRTTQKSAQSAENNFFVPFYSQFSDITNPSRQKIGCGVAGLAMIIEYYKGEKVSVDSLFETGLEAGAYLEDAGWIHSGLINLSKKYKLDGESKDFSYLDKEGALAKLETALETGPVLASVHYTFEPTNPIPHLVVINGLENNIIHYNDPAEKTGGGTISKEKFLKAWKNRFIEIRPV
ncbi:MAG: C39 family peptidase [Candidatus Paceibacterota bacterium]